MIKSWFQKKYWVRWRNIIASLTLIVTGAIFFDLFPAFCLKCQFYPAVQREGYIIAGLIVVMTILFGRLYCSIVCPFGILQDCVSKIFRTKKGVRPSRVRYFILAMLVGFLTVGVVLPVRFFDPYSNFGRVVSSIKNPTALSVFSGILLLLCVFRKRFFCGILCPVGITLKIISKMRIFRIHFNDKCLGCGKCARECPVQAIDVKKKTINNSECICCFRCSSRCPKNALDFCKNKKNKIAKNEETIDLSRRNFITGAFLLSAIAGSGHIVGKQIKKQQSNDKFICPPGAGSIERFSGKCTSCLLCANVCPSKIIKPHSFGVVRLDYTEGFCDYNCTKCGDVCPTGALEPLHFEIKQSTRIGIARFNHDECTGCKKCAEVCPRGAIETFEGKPVLSPAKCIGCGKCLYHCPKKNKAIEVIPVLLQTRAM